MASDSDALPALTCAAVDACIFSSWQSTYKHLIPKSVVIPLEADFIEYLRRDGIFMPNPDGITEIDSDEDEEANQFSFPALTAEIQRAIDRFGAVFPKLNWSSPQDAEWILSTPSCRCESPEDVYMLLKGSDFIVHDLEHAYEACVDPENRSKESYELVLKKWFDMPKSMEFRCFVRDKRLVAISQRDGNFYDFLVEPATKSKIVDLLSSFFSHHLEDSFPLTHYTFDVYITRDYGRAFLIDFNPYALHVDALLFGWPLVQRLAATDAPVLRVIEDQIQAAQTMPRFSHNRYPTDVIHLSQGKSIPEFAQSWQEALAAGVEND